MTQQLILDIFPASPQTLDNFIAGDNAAALDALRHCQPGRAIYLWGPPGAGRSHLLRAVSNGADGIYVSVRHGNADLASVIDAEAPGYRIVAVDDVEHLDTHGQGLLFRLYNRWRETGSGKNAFALVVAGDQAPLATGLREDLRTRLGWDLVFRLHLLSDDDRARALERQAHDRGLRLAPEVINWLLTYYSRDMSHLSALLDALDRYSLQRHRPITVPLLKELLATRQTPSSTGTL